MGKQERSNTTVITGAVLQDRRLTPGQKLVYARIAFFDEYFETASKTAEYLGLTEHTVRRAKRVLEKLGYIKCVMNTGHGKKYTADVVKMATQTGQNGHSDRPKVVYQTGQNGQADWPKWSSRPANLAHIDKNIEKNIGKNVNKKENKKERKTARPTLEEIKAYCQERQNQVDPERFLDYYTANGWKVGRNPMKDWKAAVRTWERSAKTYSSTAVVPTSEPYTPNNDTDQSWRKVFDLWEKGIGMRPEQTKANVEASKKLLALDGEEKVQAMIVALSLRDRTSFLTKTIKEVADPESLLRNRAIVWNFYQQHRKKWEWDYGRGDKKPWEL